MSFSVSSKTSFDSFNIKQEPLSRKRKQLDSNFSSIVDTALSSSSLNESEERTKKVRKIYHPSEKSTKASDFKFVYDSYTEARGKPKMLEITCNNCGQWILDYQKDGPGKLLRCYTDRIYHPKKLKVNTFTKVNVKQARSLSCTKCLNVLGKPFIYVRQFPKPEMRPAYRILNDHKGIPKISIKLREK